MSNAAPGFEKHPNHSVKISKFLNKLEVSVGKTVIGSTASALVLEESNYPPAYYLPLETLGSEFLISSDHTTYCPFKGTAEYFHLVHNGKTTENAIWVYRQPYDEALAIKNHLSIYANAATIVPTE